MGKYISFFRDGRDRNIRTSIFLKVQTGIVQFKTTLEPKSNTDFVNVHFYIL